MSRSQDIFSKVNFLSHLIEMMTQLTRINSAFQDVWVKKNDLVDCDKQLNRQIAYAALAKSNSMWYLASTFSRHMSKNKVLFSTFDN